MRDGAVSKFALRMSNPKEIGGMSDWFLGSNIVRKTIRTIPKYIPFTKSFYKNLSTYIVDPGTESYSYKSQIHASIWLIVNQYLICLLARELKALGDPLLFEGMYVGALIFYEQLLGSKTMSKAIRTMPNYIPSSKQKHPSRMVDTFSFNKLGDISHNFLEKNRQGSKYFGISN